MTTSKFWQFFKDALARVTLNDVPAPASAYSMNSQKITGLAAPANAGDAVRQTAKITEAALETAVDKTHDQLHAASHENGGGDEISIAGLSGEAADPQPAKINGLDADVPVDADEFIFYDADGHNNKVTGANLKTYINAASGKFVPRNSDAAAFDYTVGAFTTDGTYRDKDLSAIVPAGAIAVLLRVQIQDDAVASTFGFRRNGNANGYDGAYLYTQVANVLIEREMTVPCDANRVVEYWGSNLAFSSINVLVMGWYL